MAKTTVRGTQITDATVDLTVDVTGVTPQANGGTGATALTQALVPDVVATWSGTSTTLSLANTYYEFTGSAVSTATLPAVSGNQGEVFTVNNRGTAVANIVRAGSDSIYSSTSGAITTYSLLIGASVELVNNGTYWVVQTQTAPWANKWLTRNPGAHTAPSAYTAYYDKADTAFASLPTTLDTGQPISYTGGTQQQISSGGLYLPVGVGGNSFSYAVQDSGSGNLISRMGGKIRMGAGSTNGTLFTFAVTNQAFDGVNNTAFRMSMHLIIGQNTWDYQTVSQATGSLVFTSRGSGTLLNPLDPNSDYTMEVWINSDNTATIILPDGQRVVTSSSAEIVPYRYGFFEQSMATNTTDYLPYYAEIWYGTGTQYAPGSSGLVTRDDIQYERTAVRTLTNVTLTTPTVDYLKGSNGSPILLPQANASAANYVGVTARASGSAPIVTAFGGDTNTNILVTGWGTGVVEVNGLLVDAGSTTRAPVVITSGTNLTTAAAGAMEYNGVSFSSTIDTTSGRGLTPTDQMFRLTADAGSAIGATIADYFGTTSAFPYVASAIYEIVWYLLYTKTTAGTVTYTITSTTAPTMASAWYTQTPVGGVGTSGTTQQAAIIKSTSTATVLPATGSLTTAVNHQAEVHAIYEAGTAGNLRLRVTEGAGTVTPLRGSFYRVRRLPAGNVGTFVA